VENLARFRYWLGSPEGAAFYFGAGYTLAGGTMWVITMNNFAGILMLVGIFILIAALYWKFVR
jgi:NADH:ubiquinone oxidoreductase subunit 6 (subunit J)